MVGFGMTDVDPGRSSKDPPKYLFKIVHVGDDDSGKSAALVKFSQDSFSDSYVTTIGVDFAIKLVQIGGQIVKLQIWDTAGQERFRTITTSYYRGAQGVCIFFSLTDKKTFEHVVQWHREVKNLAVEGCPVIIVGTKSDLEEEREVDSEEAQQLAKELDVEYFEISSKTGEGVRPLFERMVEKLIKAKEENYQNGPSMSTMVKPIKGKKPEGQAKSKTCAIL